MSEVFEIYADNGNVQFSASGIITFGLSRTGNLVLSNDGATHPQPMVVGQVQATGVNPVFAYKANGPICVERVNVNGSTFNWYLRAQSFNAIGVQYWIFDSAAQAIKDPTMLDLEAALYDEYGVKTVDFTNAMMRIAPGGSTVHEIDGSIPYGRGVYLDQTTNITVPAGRVYAIVQSSPSFAFTTYDVGGYSNAENRPDTLIIDDNSGEPGGFYRWRQQALQSYQATGGYIAPNTIECGLTRFEYFDLGWQPQSSDPFMQTYGRARHTIIDVTNFVSAGAVDPTTVTGNVNATVRSVSIGGSETISQSTTPIVTCSPSGGTGPYSFEWQFVSGSSSVVPSGGSLASTFSTITYNQPAGSTRQAIYRCRVTDQNGYVGFSPDITFSHEAQQFADDYIPNALALSPLTFVSNENHAATSDVADVVGFNKPITLRVERYNYTGNIDAAAVYVYTAPLGTADWTLRGSFDPRGTALAYLDFQITGPCRLHYVIDSVSYSGRRDYFMDMVVWNLSNPGGSAQISTGKRVTITVDADDNWNKPDWTPAAISVPSLTGYVSNEWELFTDGRFFQITGINQQIWLRFIRTYSELVQSGNIFTRRLHVFHSTTGSGGPWTPYFVGAGTPENPVPYTDVACNNGDWFYVQGQINTNAGTASASWRNYIDFHDGTTVLGRLATFDISGTVDADNNYNNAPVADYKLDYLDWQDFNVVTNENYGISNHNGVNATGITHQVQLRAYLINYSGNISDGYLRAYNWNGGNPQLRGSWRYPVNGNGSFTWLVNPNEHIYYSVDAATGSGRQTGSFDVHTYNESDGGGTGTIIDAFHVNVDIDQNNDYNIPTSDVDPTPFYPSGMYGYSGSEFAQGVNGPFQLTGFNAQTSLRAYFGFNSYNFEQVGNGVISVGDGATSGSAELYVYVNGAYRTVVPLNLYGSYSGGMDYSNFVDGITFNPGDTVTFYVNVSCYPQDYTKGVRASISGHIHLQRMINNYTGAIEVTSFPYNVSLEKYGQGGIIP